MPDYSLSKIYKLVSNKTDDIYIGSCVTRLSTRLSSHKNKNNKCSSKKLFLDDAIITIVLIENYECKDKNELKARELYHITNNICINHNKPFVCDIASSDKKAYKKAYKKVWSKEYRLANADKIKEYKKEYYIDNADKFKEYKKEYRLANADKIKEDSKEYYIANADKIKEDNKEYEATHRDQINTRRRARRAEKKLAQKLEIIPI